MEEKIMTLHPQGKQGVNILKRRYDMVKDCILEIISERGSISFRELTDEVINRLTGKFDGKLVWYVVTVKLDLEARGTIERIPKKSPQMVRIKG